MFVRIVKLSFEPSKIGEFLDIFNASKSLIRNFEGCEFLELYRDKEHNNVFFTYSYWKDEQHLHNYRHSDLFIEVWTETKKLFNNKPEAWSVDKLESLA
ncbi:antibiotic biosynthesis monooxygenase [Formosa agariphila KMM 3901]|uniref:Antibiotic biosynthesis monooxygenase n=1 Tax=Formosa agariphila (strain DSM 15362 / KCTC 12365 / LMG 23005 / KMM 3901 / M-2Alg 35-1) TaxID=1347342 RepID=T2KL09_FORAG|nr:antibiotic biosynthesis monooxygenase family protein [Formosa agariphila]CDF78684.1 antibiotic biosynthesis monooxygenase [Formosa agariphila KMM 3901]